MISLHSLDQHVVLCIDDLESALDLSRAYLEKHGYYVLTATSGLEGLRILQSHPVDILVPDYEMPMMNGEAVAREVRRLYPNLPILLMSGYAGDESWPVLHLVDAYLPKLELPARLTETVAGLLHAATAPRASTA
jgi:two-component system, cell cycle sensor histidine kinase and response regulator CckA